MRAPSRRGGGRPPARRPHVAGRGPWQCRLRFFLLLFIRALAGTSGMPVPDLTQMMDDRPPGLPPGHPERLVPDLPPTETERELWAQLTAVYPRF